MKYQNNSVFDFGGNIFYFYSLLIIVTTILIARLFFVQIFQGSEYLSIAKVNAARSMPIIAPRGMIYDRYGKVLVANKPIFSVYVLQTYIKDRDELISTLSKILSVEKKDIDKILSAKKIRPFDPILIKHNVPKEIVAKIEEEKDKLSGVVVNVRPVRVYPFGKYAAHLLGYIGEVSLDEIEKYPNLNLRQGDLIGKSGIEKYYDHFLRGINGGERLNLSSFGKPSKEKGFEDPIPGKNLRLSLDIELQKAAEDSLSHYSGAIVILDVSNGEVLALASSPTFNPNIFSEPISTEQWRKLNLKNNPFLNRALSAYPPGSIFKAVSISAALQTDAFKPNSIFYCPGYFKYGSKTFKCWKGDGHGNITLFDGLVYSCNVVFYQVGLKLGPEVLSTFAKECGLGEKTGVDLPNEVKGIVPNSDWKKNKLHENWFPGDSINFGIGQGYLSTTLIQMTDLYAAIANDGKRFRPQILLEVKNPDGTALYFNEPKVNGVLPINFANLKVVKNALYQVVQRGTGKNAHISSFECAGKTGTAQNPQGKPHAWFVCYAPYNNPKIALGIFIEHGEHGDRVAATIARKILQWYYENRVEVKDKQGKI